MALSAAAPPCSHLLACSHMPPDRALRVRPPYCNVIVIERGDSAGHGGGGGSSQGVGGWLGGPSTSGSANARKVAARRETRTRRPALLVGHEGAVDPFSRFAFGARLHIMRVEHLADFKQQSMWSTFSLPLERTPLQATELVLRTPIEQLQPSFRCHLRQGMPCREIHAAAPAKIAPSPTPLPRLAHVSVACSQLSRLVHLSTDVFLRTVG